MQDVKGDQNGYPVPGGIARPPCPRGYKCGGLAVQVGGRVTGQQPVTVKNCYETYIVDSEKTKCN